MNKTIIIMKISDIPEIIELKKQRVNIKSEIVKDNETINTLFKAAASLIILSHELESLENFDNYIIYNNTLENTVDTKLNSYLKDVSIDEVEKKLFEEEKFSEFATKIEKRISNDKVNLLEFLKNEIKEFENIYKDID